MVIAEVRASQPGDASSGARGSASSSQSNEARRMFLVEMYLGSYNFGVQQNQLESAAKLPGVRRALISIVEMAVNDCGIDLLFGNEVGGHKEGLPAVELPYQDVLAPAFGPHVEAEALLNYTAAWKFGRGNSTAPVLHKKRSLVIALKEHKEKLEPQLAMWVFEVTHQGRFGFLVVGCLHVT